MSPTQGTPAVKTCLHAVHIQLVLSQVRSELLTLVGGQEGEGELGECAICQDIPEDPVVSACGHPYCRQCISAQVTPQ